MEPRLAYIALNQIRGVGPRTAQKLLDYCTSPAHIFQLSIEELIACPQIGEKTAHKIFQQFSEIDPEAEVKRAKALQVEVITQADEHYPASLRSLYNAPLALYVRGALREEDAQAVAVVGSRAASTYGLNTADRLAYQMAQRGITVVSGLARGIDRAAHEGALKAGGRTLAVLGGAIDEIYPPEHAELADRIVRHGALISEYPLGRSADRTTFPYRNRIISGLSLGTLVVESEERGGSLHTAEAAMEQGRSVMAVPGRVDLPSSKGAHGLIKNGARLVESIEDILAEFEFELPDLHTPDAGVDPRASLSLSASEQSIVTALWEEALTLDELARACAIESPQLSMILLGLEMKHVITSLPGGVVELVHDVRYVNRGADE